jgi:hypothetical protein
MDKPGRPKFERGMGIFVRLSSALAAFLGFLVVIPLTLWFSWSRRSGVAEPAVLTLFCISFVWLNVSILRWQRTLRRLGWSAPRRISFGLGPRPDDAEELEVWSRGAHFLYSFLAVVLSMLAFVAVKWVSGG